MTRRSETHSNKTEINKTNKINILKELPDRKVFFINKNLLHNTSEDIHATFCIEKYYHPGVKKAAFFLTSDNKNIYEIVEISETYRSWFINDDVCSNGHIYVTTPIDTTFFMLYYVRKYCMKNALNLTSICADLSQEESRLLLNYINVEQIKNIADIKYIDELPFYKYNSNRTLAWLSIKVKRIAEGLKNEKVHCENYGRSLNYEPHESELDKTDSHKNTLRMAYGIVCSYIDSDLHADLKTYLHLDEKPKESVANIKRKSVSLINENDTKKTKLESTSPKYEYPRMPVTPKERVLSTKEKQLAKSAKGTKSISSFFKK